MIKLPKLAIGVVCFLAGAISSHASVSQLSTDGHWWQNTLTANQRLLTIEGGVDAYQSGWVDGASHAEVRIVNALSKDPDKRVREIVENLAFAKRESHTATTSTLGEPKFPRTYAFYSAAVDDFYQTRSAKAMDLSFGQVLSCLAVNADLDCDQLEHANR